MPLFWALSVVEVDSVEVLPMLALTVELVYLRASHTLGFRHLLCLLLLKRGLIPYRAEIIVLYLYQILLAAILGSQVIWNLFTLVYLPLLLILDLALPSLVSLVAALLGGDPAFAGAWLEVIQLLQVVNNLALIV